MYVILFLLIKQEFRELKTDSSSILYLPTAMQTQSNIFFFTSDHRECHTGNAGL